MRYNLRDILALASTPGGRLRLLEGANQKLWPLLYPVACFHRRTFARPCRLVAIVGTFGKTTTRHAISTALELEPGPAGDCNSWSLLAEAVLSVRPHQRHAVIEAGISGPGQMARYARMLRPDVAVVTCIGSEHHRSLRNLLVTRDEKSLMVRPLPRSGLAVLNGDDPHVLWMANHTAAKVVTYGLGTCSDVRATDVVLDWPRGMRFRLHAMGQERLVHVQLFGRHTVYAVLAAVAVALAEGQSLDETARRLNALDAMPGRLQIVPLSNGAFVLRDEYKSAEETIDSALDTLAEVPAKRRIVVLGDVSEPRGSQGAMYRRLGEKVGRVASLAVIVASRQSFQRYSVGAVRAGMSREAMLPARRSVLKAAELLRDGIGPGDVILIKGRDTQRLERVAFALQGRPVRCDVSLCLYQSIACEACPMLERSWDRGRAVT